MYINQNSEQTKMEAEPDFSDPEDFVDESIDEDEELLAFKAKEPKVNRCMANIMVIDNLPVVEMNRYNKLLNHMKGIIGVGNILGVEMPLKSSRTTGLLFVEYGDIKEAQSAAARLNGHRLDKSHTLIAQTMNQVQSFLQVKDESPKVECHPLKSISSIFDWMSDEYAYDQFSYTHGTTTEIHLNSLPQSKELMKREDFSDQPCQWSPLGTFLSTFHQQGVVLWAGDTFERFGNFGQPRVSFLKFSLKEKFILTSSYLKISQSEELFDINVRVYDVVSCLQMYSFVLSNHKKNDPDLAVKWTADDRYMLRLDNGQLFVHDTNDRNFALLHTEPVAGVGIPVADYAPSPKRSEFVAFWTAEQNNKPACVSILNIVNKKDIRTKNLYNVVRCHLEWQDNGDFLCVKVDLYKKVKHAKDNGCSKPIYTNLHYNFEIFRVSKKDCPVDTLKIDSKPEYFGWQPNAGNRLLIIHETLNFQSGTRMRATFYQVTPIDLKMTSEFSVEVNEASWSPTGQHCVLAWTKGRMNQKLMFVDVQNQSITHSEEHAMLNYVFFDPSGRYVAACALVRSIPIDSAFTIYSFQGKKLARKRIAGLKQFTWRPRHPQIITPNQIKLVKRDMNKFNAKFRAIDEALACKLTEGQMALRMALTERINLIRNTNKGRLAGQHEERLRLRYGGKRRKSDEYIQQEMCQLLNADQQGINLTSIFPQTK
ncbi:hypothetical protein ACOME3_000237 [Neoechinorhynchus agilis]